METKRDTEMHAHKSSLIFLLSNGRMKFHLILEINELQCSDLEKEIKSEKVRFFVKFFDISRHQGDVVELDSPQLFLCFMCIAASAAVVAVSIRFKGMVNGSIKFMD